MHILSKNIIDQEYFAHACNQRAKLNDELKHIDKRARVFHEEDRVLANRKMCAIEHENQAIQNKIAINKAIDQRMQFIKNSSHLNII